MKKKGNVINEWICGVFVNYIQRVISALNTLSIFERILSIFCTSDLLQRMKELHQFAETNSRYAFGFNYRSNFIILLIIFPFVRIISVRRRG